MTHCEEMLEDCEYEILQLQLDREVLDIELEKQKQDKENISSMYDCCSEALRTSLSIKRELAFRLEKIEFRASSFKMTGKLDFIQDFLHLLYFRNWSNCSVLLLRNLYIANWT